MNKLLKGLGLILIGLYSVLALIQGGVFSQLHLNLSFLPFPIFIGEIVLIFCFFLFLFQYARGEISLSRNLIIFILGYTVWLLAKTYEGYISGGPYTFRNAAVFYYPFFALLTYGFSNRQLLANPTIIVLAILSLCISIFSGNSLGDILAGFTSLFSLSLFLLFQAFRKNSKLFLGLAFLLSLGTSFALSQSRLTAFMNALDHSTIKSALHQIPKYPQKFKMRPLPVQLYNPDILPQKNPISSNPSQNDNGDEFIAENESIVEKELPGTIFRILIWRDMLHEIQTEKPWLGFSFGKPQRSPSIEMTGWTYKEWHTMGWTSPHNSYLHIIYRAGIFGLFFLVFLGWLLLRTIKESIQLNSLSMALGNCFLIDCFVLANSISFLETPHHAIPFWSFLGVMLGYSREKFSASASKL